MQIVPVGSDVRARIAAEYLQGCRIGRACGPGTDRDEITAADRRSQQIRPQQRDRPDGEVGVRTRRTESINSVARCAAVAGCRQSSIRSVTTTDPSIVSAREAHNHPDAVSSRTPRVPPRTGGCANPACAARSPPTAEPAARTDHSTIIAVDPAAALSPETSGVEVHSARCPAYTPTFEDDAEVELVPDGSLLASSLTNVRTAA